MTHQQALAFGLVLVTIGFFVWGRFRYDVISLVALLASVLLGLTPAKKAFDGFSNDVVVIIACALVVSAGVRALRRHRGGAAADHAAAEERRAARSRCSSPPRRCSPWPPRTSAPWRS